MISDGSIIMAKIGVGIIKAKIPGREERSIIRLNLWGVLFRLKCPVLYRLKLKLLCFICFPF